MQEKISFFFLVSIPYGTIKSYTSRTKASNLCEFQFHMVRLKDKTLSNDLYNVQFQFHMVRLKDTWEYLRRTPVSFQFHMVRLKELNGVGILLSTSRFNSIWYD